MRKAPATSTPAAVTFECSCGTVHHAPSGQIPVGWSTHGGSAWCDDCTRAGIPAREIKRRAA